MPIIEIGIFANGRRSVTGTKKRMSSQRGVTGPVVADYKKRKLF